MRRGVLLGAVAVSLVAAPTWGQEPADNQDRASNPPGRASETERLRFLSLVHVPLSPTLQKVEGMKLEPQKVEAIRDGTSFTILLGERRTEGRLEGCSAPAARSEGIRDARPPYGASLSALGFEPQSPVRAQPLDDGRIEVRIASRADPECTLVGLFTRVWPAKWETPTPKGDAGKKSVKPPDVYVTHDQTEPLPGPKPLHPGVYIVEIGDPTGESVQGQVRVIGPADFEARARRGDLRTLVVEASGSLAETLVAAAQGGRTLSGRLHFTISDEGPITIEVPNLEVTIGMTDTSEPVRVELRFPHVIVQDR